MSEYIGKVGFRIMKKYIKEDSINLKDFMFGIKIMGIYDSLNDVAFVLKEFKTNGVSVNLDFIQLNDYDLIRFKYIENNVRLFDILCMQKDRIKNIMESSKKK